MSRFARGALAGAVGTLLLLALIALIVVLTGSYNVAATDRHNPIIGWALQTSFENSVQGRAEALQPPQFTQAMVDAGAPEYKSMCAHCHGGIGQARAGWAETMRPKPPALAHAAQGWNGEEVFWLVKHGVKMSGMPAFGPSHDDATIWNIAAFVKAMPEMSEAQYASYSAEHGEEGAGGAGHEHAKGAAPHED